ncbi:15371_t:CDS:2 [Cetraspora pellucida]|uniref:15371_t:CDS:1 n=1 Tax=Cetraspora pellucida TaxID=1433469 RepID=A0ACA9MSE8_9GLOM|nr:15371_t:CDS:2 [Cetraspora pellucida]
MGENKSNITASISQQSSIKKLCTCCGIHKKKENFYRVGNLNESGTCNQCSERRKNKRKETNSISRKRAKLQDSTNTTSSSSSNAFTFHIDSSNNASIFQIDTLQTDSNSINSIASISQIDNSSNAFTSQIDSSSNTFFSQVDSSIEEIDLFSEQEDILKDNTNENFNNKDYRNDDSPLYGLDEVQEIIAKKFQKAENNSENVDFALEIELNQQLFENIPCSQEDIYSRSFDFEKIKDEFYQLIKILILVLESGSGYYWEIRHRYACMGNIILTISLQQQCAFVQCQHLEAHLHPQYHKVEFSLKAREWIQKNIKYYMRNSELYKRLKDEMLIDPQVHTNEQVYYWASVYSRKTYIMNSGNQVLSAKLYLEQPKFITKGFKILNFIENDFVKALGFTTPLLSYIGATNITEIVIDSTFKTNEEQFELFAVNANYGGYGLPLAYLYFLTLNGNKEALDDSKNKIKTRVQLCYWHLEHAIKKQLNEKSKFGKYTKVQALEAHKKFKFIDLTWISTKDTFWTSSEIYCACTKEIYQFCYSRFSAAIPLARMTMIVESHWRVLKYKYKYNYNRPHLDRLTQILAEQLVPDFELKLVHHNTNRTLPTWWELFKKEWNKAAVMHIEPDMDKRHYINVDNWVCSCLFYQHNHYFVCKHLVLQKNSLNFMPIFMETQRRYDYPFLTFGLEKMPTILSTSNLWTRYNKNKENDPIEKECDSVEEGSSTFSHMHDVLAARNIIKLRQKKLSCYKKTFDAAIALYEREINNNKFTRNFDSLIKPIVKAINECEQVLNARKQQSTTGSSNGKLLFWLH